MEEGELETEQLELEMEDRISGSVAEIVIREPELEEEGEEELETEEVELEMEDRISGSVAEIVIRAPELEEEKEEQAVSTLALWRCFHLSLDVQQLINVQLGVIPATRGDNFVQHVQVVSQVHQIPT
jgi:ribosomal protein S25